MLITTYKEANQLQSSCISLPTATVRTCSYTTRVVWQTKCKLMTYISRVLHVFAIPHVHTNIACTPTLHAHQRCVQQCMLMPVFEVLHVLNVQAHTCVKFKLSCTVKACAQVRIHD